MPIPGYRALQTTSTTGSGALVLDAATTSYRSFQAALGGSARRCRYGIDWSTGFEIALGDFDGGNPGTISRGTPIASSAGGATVSLPAGSKNVFLVPEQIAPEISTISGNTTVALTDLGTLYVTSGSGNITLTLPTPATVPPGEGISVRNSGTGILSIVSAGAGVTISGLAPLVMPPGDSCEIVRVGSNWEALFTRPGLLMVRRQVFSAVAAVDFALLGAGFLRYELELDDIRPATTDAQIILRCSTDNGVTYASGAGDYNATNVTGTGTTVSVSTGAGGFLPLSAPLGAIGGTPQPCTGAIKFTVETGLRMHGQTFGWNSNGTYAVNTLSGVRTLATMPTHVRVMASSGNLASGSATLHARRH